MPRWLRVRRGRVSILQCRNSPGNSWCIFAWSGNNSEYQKKKKRKSNLKGERWEPLISLCLPRCIRRQKMYLCNSTAAATPMGVSEVGYRSHTMEITHFTDAEMIISSVPNVYFSSSCWHSGLDTPPATSGANSYLFATGCYFCFETRGVTWHLLRQYPFLLSASLYPPSRIQGWVTESDKSIISEVTLNWITSCIMRDSTLGTRFKWLHVLVAGFYGVNWWTV